MGNRNFEHQKPRIDLVKQASLLAMGFRGGSVVKNLLQCRRCRFLGKEMVTHSSILAWEILNNY